MAFQAQGFVSAGVLPARRRYSTSVFSPATSSNGSSTQADKAPHSRPARRFRSLAAMCFCFCALLTALSLLTLIWQKAAGGNDGASCRKATDQQPRIQRVAYTPVATNYSTSSAAAGRKGSGTFTVQDRYTIIINSFRRPALLKAALAHYCACPQADAIHVVWSEDLAGPPTALEDASYYCNGETEVVYDLQPTSSLNNRFAPLPGLRTQAILSMDDDIRCVPVSHLLMSSAQLRHHSATTSFCGSVMSRP